MQRISLCFLSIVLIACGLSVTGRGQEAATLTWVEPLAHTNDQDLEFVTTVADATELDSFDYSAECTCCDSSHCGHSDIWTRSNLTNGFWGAVPKLAEHGIMYKATITQFYQGVATGGNEQRFRYGDKIDQYLIFDSEKLGLWKGGKLIMHGDTQLGQTSIADAALLAPVNTAMLTPKPAEVGTAITHFQYEHELGHGLAATLGKFNFIDLWGAIYPEYGLGLDGFMNTSQLAPLNVVPTLPVIFNAAGLLKSNERGITAAVMAIDTRETQTFAGLDGLLEDGVTILGLYRKFTDFGGLPGSHLFAGTYATGTFTDFDPQGWLILPGGNRIPLIGEQRGSWLAAYVLDQKLWVDCCNPKRSVGVWGMLGYSDSNTSPYDWTMNISLQAFGLLPGREGDRMGIGYFYEGVSEDLKELVPALGLRDLQGGEVYYNAEITPWFHLTTDLQVIQTEVDSQDTAVVLGFRGKVDL